MRVVACAEIRAVFDNIPARLTEDVRNLRGVIDVSTDKKYIAAAAGVAAEYIGKNFFSPKTDTFLAADRTNATGAPWYGYSIRILLIGETLFSLRSSLGFSEFCKSFKSRDLRSAFYELYAAKIFMRSGFEIHGRPRTRVRGQDFDFHVTRRGETINVEVTALAPSGYSAKTLSNALNHKRKQLPKTDPSIIICVIPEEWSKNRIVWNISLYNLAHQFLRTTRRVNGLVFLMERHLGASETGGGAFVIHQQTILNEREPYFNIKDPTFLFEGVPGLLDTELKTDALLGKADEIRTSEFYRWVDHLLPTTSA